MHQPRLKRDGLRAAKAMAWLSDCSPVAQLLERLQNDIHLRPLLGFVVFFFLLYFMPPLFVPRRRRKEKEKRSRAWRE